VAARVEPICDSDHVEPQSSRRLVEQRFRSNNL